MASHTIHASVVSGDVLSALATLRELQPRLHRWRCGRAREFGAFYDRTIVEHQAQQTNKSNKSFAIHEQRQPPPERVVRHAGHQLDARMRARDARADDAQNYPNARKTLGPSLRTALL